MAAVAGAASKRDDDAPPVLEQVKAMADRLSKNLTSYCAEQYYRDELYTQYTTQEVRVRCTCAPSSTQPLIPLRPAFPRQDFLRCKDDLKRVVVIGCTGAGKSTLLNVMGGWKFVQNQTTDDMEYEWVHPSTATTERTKAAGEEEEVPTLLFESKGGVESVTNKTSFATMKWFGNAARKFIAVDTPGHDDSAGYEIDSQEARDKLGELAADLHDKLKAMGHIHVLLILHNDPTSNRLNPATYTILKMIDAKFAETGEEVWKHVVVAYSKCNPHDSTWRAGMKSKKVKLLAKIHEEFPKSAGIEIPIIALGGGVKGNADGSPLGDVESAGDFEELWKKIEAAPLLDTTRIEPFKGIDRQYEDMINAKNKAEARAKAAMIWFSVVFKVGVVCFFLFFRAFMLPGWMGMVLLNFDGMLDELVLIGVVVWLIGTQDVTYSLKHVYDMWIKPRIGPVHDQVKGLYQRYTGKQAAPSKAAKVKAAQGKKD
jgi:hypothetical protein